MLVVDPDADRAAELARQLQRSGFESSLADDCLHALTMLEWHRPDLILLRPAACEHMSPAEFRLTVRQDPLFQRIPVALIAPPHRGLGFDVVLEEASPEVLAQRVCELLWRGIGSNSQAAEAPNKGNLSEFSRRPVGRLLGLVDQLGIRRVCGLLKLELADVPFAFYLFDHGQVVHARCSELDGPEAMQRILDSVSKDPQTLCSFVPLDRQKLSSYPRTIRHPDRERLLSRARGSDALATREVVVPIELPDQP